MKIINEHQKKLYASFASSGSEKQLNRYLKYLKDVEQRKNIKILDIGGATGEFGYLLEKHFESNGVEVYVVDNVVYDTWSNVSSGGSNSFVIQ